MATVYGTNAAFETARTVVKSQLDSLISAMATGYDPKIAAAYLTHWSDPAPTFNAVTIGIEGIVGDFPAMKSSPAGPVIDMQFQIELRVLIGNRNIYYDEIKVARLCNSIVNWFNEHRNLGSGFTVKGTFKVEPCADFSDIQAIGGRVEFAIRTTEAYVAT